MSLFSWTLWVPRTPSLAPSAPMASLTVRAPMALPGKPARCLGALRHGEVSSPPPGSPGPAVPPYSPQWGSPLLVVRVRISFTSASPASLGAYLHAGALPTVYCIQRAETLSSAY